MSLPLSAMSSDVSSAIRYAARRISTPPHEARVGDPGPATQERDMRALYGMTSQPSIPLRQAQGHLALNAKVVALSRNSTLSCCHLPH